MTRPDGDPEDLKLPVPLIFDDNQRWTYMVARVDEALTGCARLRESVTAHDLRLTMQEDRMKEVLVSISDSDEHMSEQAKELTEILHRMSAKMDTMWDAMKVFEILRKASVRLLVAIGGVTGFFLLVLQIVQVLKNWAVVSH